MATFRLFGYQIKKVEPNTEGSKQALPKDQNLDGAIELQAGVAGFWGSGVTFNDAPTEDEAQLVGKYREISTYPEIERAIDDIINESFAYDEDDYPVSIDLDHIESLQNSTKDKIREEFTYILDLLNFKEDCYEIFRRWYVDGRVFYQKVINDANPTDGIIELRYIDPRKIKKIRHEFQDKERRIIDGVDVNKKYVEYYIYNPAGVSPTNPTGLRIALDSITFSHSGKFDKTNKLILSHLHKAIRPLNQLNMMENALVIYRMVRAPERRVFNVEFGRGTPPSKVEEKLNSIMNKFRRKVVYDPTTGEISDDNRYQVMQEDFWFAKQEGKGTDVTTLQGGQTLGQIDDITYFRGKLIEALNVPQSRFEQGTGFNLGRACLAMDTKVPLLDGRELSISEIAMELKEDKKLWAYSCNPETGEIEPGPINWAGVTQKSARVMKITFDNQEEVICTLDHKFPVWNKGFVEAKDLVVGESMIPLYREKGEIYYKSDYEKVYQNDTSDWIYTHRLVMNWKSRMNNYEVYTFNPTNENLKKDVRHHRDFNRFNNNPDNLVWMNWKDHRELHCYHNHGLMYRPANNQKQNRNHKIISIEFLPESIEVGTLSIDNEHHTFALTSGVFTKNSEVSRDELKFMKFVHRLRKRFSMIFEDILGTQLVLKEILTPEEWDEIKGNLIFDYLEDSYFDELKWTDIWQTRIQTLQASGGGDLVSGKWVSRSWVRENILHMQEEEWDEEQRKIDDEAEDQAKLEAENRVKGLDAQGNPLPPFMMGQGQDGGDPGNDEEGGDKALQSGKTPSTALIAPQTPEQIKGKSDKAAAKAAEKENNPDDGEDASESRSRRLRKMLG